MGGLYLWYLTVSSLTLLAIVAAANIDTDHRMEGILRVQEDDLDSKFRYFKTLMEHEIKKLKNKVDLLETKVKQQDGLLQECGARITSSNSLLTVEKKTTAISNPKTCWEAHVADHSLESGMYWIDPDGSGRGDEPIYVYCNMTTGSTSVLHDSEDSIDVGHCFDPGCYSREIKYNGTLRQIIMLSELSKECHQTIEVDCFGAALEFNNIAYAWWNDRNGERRYFWSGNDHNITSGRHYHTCQCGLENSCQDKNLACNCDSVLGLKLSDKGEIKEKGLLPVTKLNFGRTVAPTSSIRHKLGHVQCNGKVVLDGMPTSCQDLWRIGYALSGLYSIKGSSDKVETVYCDFEKLPGDEGLETLIGFNEVKSASVYFSVLRNSTQENDGERFVLTYDYETLNIGDGMNVSSGIFTAPISGTYFFIYHGVSSNYNTLPWLAIVLNNVQQLAECFPHRDYLCTTFSNVKLEAGDRIELIHASGSISNAEFNGWLITEDIFKP